MIADDELRDALMRLLKLDDLIGRHQEQIRLLKAEIRDCRVERDLLSQELRRPPSLPLFKPPRPPAAAPAGPDLETPAGSPQVRPGGARAGGGGESDLAPAATAPGASQDVDGTNPQTRRKPPCRRIPSRLADLGGDEGGPS